MHDDDDPMIEYPDRLGKKWKSSYSVLVDAIMHHRPISTNEESGKATQTLQR